MADNIIAISLFSGAGGLDLGAKMAGARVVACIDYEKDAIETLRLNEQIGGADLYHDSIVGFATKAFADRIKKESPSGVILIGGPPCQPFSKNGYWVKNENRKSMRDERNMVREYFRVLSELRPDGFVLENVESILHPTNAEAVEFILEEAERLGYGCKAIRTNAADFGVPQRRKRVFFIGVRRKLNGAMPQRTHVDPKDADLLSNLPLHRGVGEVLAPYANDRFFEPEETTVHGTYHADLLNVPPGKNYMALRADGDPEQPKWRPGSRFWNFLLKLEPNSTSWTIPAQPGPWVGPFHWDNRRLRVPEIAAIQTFPSEYKFHGSRRSIQKQLGNAVPPKLGEAVVKFLLEQM